MNHSNLNAASSLSRTHVVSVLLLAIPPVVLMFSAMRHDSFLLACGAAGALLGSLLFVGYARIWRPPVCGSVILITLIGLAWLWFGVQGEVTAFDHLSRASLLSLAIGLLMANDLTRSGVEARRRAVKLCRKLQERTWWPQEPSEFALLPEVRALRFVLARYTRVGHSIYFTIRVPRSGSRSFSRYNPDLIGEATRRQRSSMRSKPRPIRRPVPKESEPSPRRTIRGLSRLSVPFYVIPVRWFAKPSFRRLLNGPAEKWYLVRETLRVAMADPKFQTEGPLLWGRRHTPSHRNDRFVELGQRDANRLADEPLRRSWPITRNCYAMTCIRLWRRNYVR